VRSASGFVPKRSRYNSLADEAVTSSGIVVAVTRLRSVRLGRTTMSTVIVIYYTQKRTTFHRIWRVIWGGELALSKINRLATDPPELQLAVCSPECIVHQCCYRVLRVNGCYMMGYNYVTFSGTRPDLTRSKATDRRAWRFGRPRRRRDGVRIATDRACVQLQYRCDPAERRFRRAEAAVSVHVGTTATAAAIAVAGRRFVDSAFGEAVVAAAVAARV